MLLKALLKILTGGTTYNRQAMLLRKCPNALEHLLYIYLK